MSVIRGMSALLLILSAGCASAGTVQSQPGHSAATLPADLARICTEPERVIAGESQCVLGDQGLRPYAGPIRLPAPSSAPPQHR